MKTAVCLLIALLVGLIGLNPTAFSAPRKVEILQNPETGRTLLADRIETKDSITYTTDPGLDRAMKKEERQEEEKENNSWKMLQNMPLYIPYFPPAAQPGAKPSK